MSERYRLTPDNQLGGTLTRFNLLENDQTLLNFDDLDITAENSVQGQAQLQELMRLANLGHQVKTAAAGSLPRLIDLVVSLRMQHRMDDTMQADRSWETVVGREARKAWAEKAQQDNRHRALGAELERRVSACIEIAEVDMVNGVADEDSVYCLIDEVYKKMLARSQPLPAVAAQPVVVDTH